MNYLILGLLYLLLGVATVLDKLIYWWRRLRRLP